MQRRTFADDGYVYRVDFVSCDLLRMLDACTTEVRRFRDRYGKKKWLLDSAMIRDALKQKFDVHWFVNNLVCAHFEQQFADKYSQIPRRDTTLRRDETRLIYHFLQFHSLCVPQFVVASDMSRNRAIFVEHFSKHKLSEIPKPGCLKSDIQLTDYGWTGTCIYDARTERFDAHEPGRKRKT